LTRERGLLCVYWDTAAAAMKKSFGLDCNHSLDIAGTFGARSTERAKLMLIDARFVVSRRF
jgi:hypothetical protein